ncbi:histidine kinase [Kineosporia rhizophila]|uniref:sensor histidine kinase n=1 Tax=Kineosporia rhizophila TaxID=84633 RepID=UPI001E5AD91D|nr:histidine kinase [Kineosporia rhizophila]MCE0536478.1 histidine kinase [Kineosporia rhizophila]
MTDAGTALRRHPARFLGSSWPWRSIAYLATTVVAGLAVWPLLVVSALLGGVPATLAGAVERSRLRLVQQRPPEPIGLRARLRARQRMPVDWLEIAYLLLLGTVLWLVDTVALLFAIITPAAMLAAPWLATREQIQVIGWQVSSGGEAWLASGLGVLLAAAAAYLLTLLAAGQSRLARALLDSRAGDLAATVADLRRSRVDLVDAFETERRRIERDLHDGVQQRLVALTMTLGRAELDVPEGPGLEALHDAQRQAEAALADLRSTIRGIHPRVLVDHGLAAAVHEIADRSPVPATVDVRLEGRLPPPVEQAAYFVVSEALTNVARHSRARRVGVHAWRQGQTFVLTVEDDGVGGATAHGPGTGLAGLRVRLDALGGTLRVTSPPGGPTEMRMECPV